MHVRVAWQLPARCSLLALLPARAAPWSLHTSAHMHALLPASGGFSCSLPFHSLKKISKNYYSINWDVVALMDESIHANN